ncbi:MAG: adenosylcobinamide-phosphate synthase CbiB [Gammaproteobacteria bacterium]|nr:adenosylcobinamide-phosphate synthase CbiB [Gammaproteobacteria bacterium]
MGLLVAMVIALSLDYWLGEPKRLHPLVGFGNLANRLERWLNTPGGLLQLKGTLALSITIIPLGFAAYSLEQSLAANSLLSTLFAGVVLYIAIGWTSLIQHAKAISVPLRAGDLLAAREAVGRIVSRDTQHLTEPEIAKAATESVLENGADAIFAALFWFILAGIPGVVVYRLSNTLDAMWGYKNQRFLHFGWAAARFDDLLNYIPARLTALTYTLCGAVNGQTKNAWHSWRQQAGTWKSPNAGPVMAAGAGAIGVQLGGNAQYHGQTQRRPVLGTGKAPMASSIDDACVLVNYSLAVWMVLIGMLAVGGAIA